MHLQALLSVILLKFEWNTVNKIIKLLEFEILYLLSESVFWIWVSCRVINSTIIKLLVNFSILLPVENHKSENDRFKIEKRYILRCYRDYNDNCRKMKGNLWPAIGYALVPLTRQLGRVRLKRLIRIYAISINTQVIIQNRALWLVRYLGLSADNHLDEQNGCQLSAHFWWNRTFSSL